MDMDFTNLEWYKAGTITVLKNETTVRGSGTGWLAAGIKKGDVLLTEDFQIYQVASVTNSEELQIDRAFQGDDYVGREYRVIPRAAAVLQAEIANRLARIIPEWEKWDKALDEGLRRLEDGLAALEHGTGGDTETAIDSGEVLESNDAPGDSSGGTQDDGTITVEVNGEEYV